MRGESAVSGNELIRGIESLQFQLDQTRANYEKLLSDHSDLQAKLEAANNSIVSFKFESRDQQSEIRKLLETRCELREEKDRLLQKLTESESMRTRLDERLAAAFRLQAQAEKKSAETEIELQAVRGSLEESVGRSKALAQELSRARADQKRAENDLEAATVGLSAAQDEWIAAQRTKDEELKAKDQEITRLRERLRLEGQTNERLLASAQDSERSKKALLQEIELNQCQVQLAQEELQKSVRAHESAQAELCQQIQSLMTQNEKLTGTRAELSEQVKALTLANSELGTRLSQMEEEKKSLQTDFGTRLETQIQTLHASHAGKKQEQEAMKSLSKQVAQAVARFSTELAESANGTLDKIPDPAEARREQLARGRRFLQTIEAISGNEMNSEAVS